MYVFCHSNIVRTSQAKTANTRAISLTCRHDPVHARPVSAGRPGRIGRGARHHAVVQPRARRVRQHALRAALRELRARNVGRVPRRVEGPAELERGLRVGADGALELDGLLQGHGEGGDAAGQGAGGDGCGAKDSVWVRRV